MTKKEARKELRACEKLWSRYSCDCLSFYMNWLIRIIEGKQL